MIPTQIPIVDLLITVEHDQEQVIVVLQKANIKENINLETQAFFPQSRKIYERKSPFQGKNSPTDLSNRVTITQTNLWHIIWSLNWLKYMFEIYNFF